MDSQSRGRFSDVKERKDAKNKGRQEGELDIKSVFQSFFKDFPGPGEEIKRQTSREQKVVATLDLLLKSLKTYPETFLTGDNSFKPEEYYFSFWTVYRLVVFLAASSYSSLLYQKFAQAVCSLTTLLKYKHQKLFISVNGTLVMLIQDVHSIVRQMFIHRNLSGVSFPISLKHFKNANPGSISDTSCLCLKNEADTWTFLQNLSEVIFLFLSDPCQALGYHCKPLWKIFSAQALWKDSSVQEVSLRCVDCLLKTSNFSREAVSDDLFTAVIACLRNITSQDTEPGPETNLKLQSSLACLLNTAIKPRGGQKCIPLALVNSLMKSICHVSGNFDAVLCQELRLSISQMVCVVCIEDRLADPFLCRSLKTCAKNWIDWFLNSSDFQFLANCLSEIVLYDLRQRKQPENGTVKRKKVEAMDVDMSDNELNAETYEDLCAKYKLQETTLNYLYMKFSKILEVLTEQAISEKFCTAVDGMTLVFRTFVLLVGRHTVLDERNLTIISDVTNAVVHELKSAMFTVLEKLSSSIIRSTEGGDDTVKCIMGTLLNLVKLLLYCHVHIPVPRDHLHVCICIASVPWINKVSSEYSTILPCVKDWSLPKWKQVASGIARNMDCAVCYEVMTMFPSEFMPKWRICVFKEILGSCDFDMQNNVITLLPVFVAALENKERSEILDTVLKHSHQELVQNSLGKCFGQLGCALCRCVTSTLDVSKFPLTVQESSCTVCDSGDKSNNIIACPGDLEAFFFQVLELVVLKVPAKVKLSFVSGFKRLQNHVEFSPEYYSRVLYICIDLIEDPDYNVRFKFSKLLPCLTNKDVGGTKMVVTKLKDAYTKASTMKKLRLQETIVHTIGELGKKAEEDLLLVVIVSLLETLLSKTKIISSLAFTQIRGVAKYKKKPLQELFGDLKLHICKFMVDTVIKQQQDSMNDDSDYCLEAFTTVSSVFHFKSIKALMQNAQSIIIPQLVLKALPQSSIILRQLAKHLKVNYRKDLLLLNFNFIFSYLVRTCSGEELKEALAFVERETNVDLGSLLKSDSQSVVNQLLLHLKSSYNKVFTGLSILANKAGTAVTDIPNSEEMAEFLQPRLLGILAFFNTVLLDDKNLEEKNLALASLVKLMELMGAKYISVVRVKIMAILKLALQFESKDLCDLCCEAWDCFVRCLDVMSLKLMLGHIVVTLIPLIDHSVDKVANIFRYLIMERKDELKENFKDIYFIPEYPQFNDIRTVYEEVIKSKRNSDLREEINEVIKCVSHESAEVRHHAVLRLKTLLHENQNALHEYITRKDEVDPVVCNVIDTLIGRCGEPSTQAKVGECLGELGAIDPGWLGKPEQTLNEEPVVYEMMCDSSSFAVDLLNELVRAFLAAADTRSQDCSAYAIQEVLQIYECSNTSRTSRGYKLWHEFPEHIQEILKPHLYSKYRLSAQSNRGKPNKPIYGSNTGQNFSDWINMWTLELVSKVQNTTASRLFKACSAVFKHDINTAIFLLPHIMLYVAIDGSPEDYTEVYDEILAVLKHVEERNPEYNVTKSSSDFSHISAQTIFSLLDYLTRWARLKADSNSKTQILNTRPGASARDNGLSRVVEFLDGIPQKTLATASFHCKAYARSLMHFEHFIEKSQEDLQLHLNSIQRLYWALNEPDGVVGVAAVRKCPASLEEEILEHKSAGKLRDAVACYERAIQLEPDTIENLKSLMSCWITLGQVSTALEHANGVLTTRPAWTSSINSFRVEACWRLGQWDELESYVKLEHHCTDWSTGVGKILLAARRKDKDEFSNCIYDLRLAQMEPLSAARMESGSYQRGYDFIIRLHILHELEDCLSNIFHDDNCDIIDRSIVDTMLSNLQNRLTITRASFQAREPILSIRRVMLKLLLKDEDSRSVEDHCLLQTAKVARKAEHFQTAYSYLLNISSLTNTTECCLEQSKLLWAQGNCREALLRLEKLIAESSKTVNSDNSLTKAKTMLYASRWMEETANYGAQSILAQYKEVVSLHDQWENAHFYLAKYYEKIMNSFADTKKSGTLDFLPFVMRHYGESLHYGHKFIYQSVPKILQFWLDFGANVQEQGKQSKSERSAMIQRLEGLNNIISELTDRLPAYQFFTAFPQLISRMCHRNEDVWTKLKALISKLLVTYPQQAIWLMMAVSKSTHAQRKSRCQQIFQAAKRADKQLGKFIEDACKLAQLLIEVSEKNRGKENVLSMSHDFGILKRLVSENNFSAIIIPLQSSLTVTLPTGHGIKKEYYPFPDCQPTFLGFEDKIDVLQSLARPKKLTVKASDGQNYNLLCKPKDDLRKDSRTMEFNSLINKCLRKDPECRRRQLHIRTYAVVPLNEECGLLEWVPNTCGLRNILTKMYKEKGMYVRSSELRRLYDSMSSASKEERKRIFQMEVLKRYPPIFHDWFLKTFPTPTSWYNSRLGYCRTAAVMSMVGYILGLGDRHGENILFDSTNGDCVHVDFNCLFNKGETFECPECVPFRLTHNMIQAMGPLGYEGIFRRSCEVTLKIMRNQHDSLLSVLKTFVYDPLVEWGDKRHRDNAATAAAKEEGLKIVKQIDQRLRGYSKKNAILIPLSIEGEVHQLITEATDVDNLSRMYIGWAAHL